MKLITGLEGQTQVHVPNSRGLLFCGMAAIVGTGPLARAHVYTAATFPVTPETHKAIDAEKLAGELEVDMCAVNSGRHWMHDEYYYMGSEVVNFHGVEMRWVGEMTAAEAMAQFGAVYTPSLIYRNTNWVWHAGKPVYLLREPNGTVWVLQEYGNEVDETLTADNLDRLGGMYKDLPEGWTFETKILDEELSLDTSRAGGWAAIMRDEFGCTFQACGYGADTNANYVP